MSHYLKLTMDAVFGRNKFQTEITWKRTYAHNDRVFGNVADTILFYGEPCQLKDEILIPLDEEYIEEHFTLSDDRGRYQLITLTGPGTSTGESGRVWKGVDPTKSNRHWSPPLRGRIAKWIETNFIPNYRQVQSVHARLDNLDETGFIYWPKNKGGKPRLKRYLMEGTLQVFGQIFHLFPIVLQKQEVILLRNHYNCLNESYWHQANQTM